MLQRLLLFRIAKVQMGLRARSENEIWPLVGSTVTVVHLVFIDTMPAVRSSRYSFAKLTQLSGRTLDIEVPQSLGYYDADFRISHGLSGARSSTLEERNKSLVHFGQ